METQLLFEKQTLQNNSLERVRKGKFRQKFRVVQKAYKAIISAQIFFHCVGTASVPPPPLPKTEVPVI